MNGELGGSAEELRAAGQAGAPQPEREADEKDKEAEQLTRQRQLKAITFRVR